MVFCVFLWTVSLNHADLGMVRKISSCWTSYLSKSSLTIKTDDVTSGTRVVVWRERLRAVQGRMG